MKREILFLGILFFFFFFSLSFSHPYPREKRGEEQERGYLDSACCRGCSSSLPCRGSGCVCHLPLQTPNVVTYRLRGCMKSGTLWFDSTVRDLINLIVCQQNSPNFLCHSDSEKRYLYVLKRVNNETVFRWGADDSHRHRLRQEKGEGNLVLVRDVRRIIVSANFWWSKHELKANAKVTNTTAARFLKESLDFINFNLLQLCEENRHMMMVHYEDLKQKPMETVRAITEYLGLYRFGEVREDILSKVIDLNTIENLKKKEDNKELYGTQRPQGGSRRHIREGKTVDFEQNYDKPILEAVEKEMCSHRSMNRYVREKCEKRGFQDPCLSGEIDVARDLHRTKMYG